MEHHTRDISPATPAETTLRPGLVLKLAREERAFLSKLAQNMISQPRVRVQKFVDSLSPNRSWTYEHVRVSSHEGIRSEERRVGKSVDIRSGRMRSRKKNTKTTRYTN